jgi:hypothetical protein
MEANKFRDWQADYAAHGIPTVPVEFIREGDGIRIPGAAANLDAILLLPTRPNLPALPTMGFLRY